MMSTLLYYRKGILRNVYCNLLLTKAQQTPKKTHSESPPHMKVFFLILTTVKPLFFMWKQFYLVDITVVTHLPSVSKFSTQSAR